MKVTDIYEAMNNKAEAFFEWLQAHPKYGLLFGVGLTRHIQRAFNKQGPRE